MELRDTVLSELPDLPRWVEARGMLLSGRGQVLETADGGRVVCSPADRLIVPLGIALPENIAEIAARQPGSTLLLQDVMIPSARFRLPDWDASRATLYVLPKEVRTLDAPRHPAELLSRSQIESAGVPGPMRDELIDALGRSPVWGAIKDGRPVAFAYASQATERWFDVSVDTLEQHRRQGYGRSAAIALIVDRMMKGLQAVWGAVDENDASRQLAERLGFAPADEMWVLTPPPA
jgi:RimJ/RimL family protein N-acetyltransferase